jgi:type IV secretion system protein VirD4
MTAWLDTPSLARLVCGSDSGPAFSLHDFVAGRVDVFINVPLKTLDSTPQAARLIIGALLNAKYEQGVNNSDERTLFLIDEMPRLRKMDILETARDAGRGYGVTLWAIVQDLGQLEKYYGETGRRSWLENCQIKTFFGISDIKTASLLAEMLGKSTIEVTTTGHSTGSSHGFLEIFGQSNASTNSSTNLTDRDLMTADEIMRMTVDSAGVPDEQLLFLRGTAPLKCGLAKWYRRPEWASLVDE